MLINQIDTNILIYANYISILENVIEDILIKFVTFRLYTKLSNIL